MDDFIFLYIVLAIVGVVGFFLFWGAVIYIIVRIFRSNSGLTGMHKAGLAAGLLQLISRGGGGGGSTDPMDSRAGSIAAGEGIDLNDRRY